MTSTNEQHQTLDQFLADHVQRTGNPGDRIGVKELYYVYLSTILYTGVQPLGLQATSKRLREIGLQSSRSGPGGRTVWIGVKLV